ncbi:MAG: transporter substrate-binding domain-containing protein [Spirochaetaceae bacterium]|jgi:L-cystine transport system substrate-binding protein|nr:transporter substrate-binding domain-containing protein [Spirochaetaceae bacterium]
MNTKWLLLPAALLVLSCSGKKAKTNSAAVQKVRSAHTQTYVPYGFINEKGESDGFEIAVLREIDALLPDYEFEFVGTSDDDLLIGIETGKYALGTKGAWLTEERKKKFIIPQHNSAVSIIGIAFRKENAKQIHDMESFARFSGKLVPVPPQSAQWPIIEDFNAAHPDTPVKLIASDVFIIPDAYTWLIESRYDAFFDIKLSFQTQVEAPDGAWHRYADRLAYVPYRAIPTYPLFNRNYGDLAAKCDTLIAVLRENGKLRELSERYFGEDIFQYE